MNSQDVVSSKIKSSEHKMPRQKLQDENAKNQMEK